VDQVVDSTRSVWSSTVFPTDQAVDSWQWRIKLGGICQTATAQRQNLPLPRNTRQNLAVSQ